MLAELSVENLALLERASLAFGPGLNVVTGATGAGKSLLLEALELLLGQRTRAGADELVRAGAERARVEGRFELREPGALREVVAWMERHHPELAEDVAESGELVLARTVTPDGKSRAHVDHRPVTQRVLRELAAKLVEIHGQNDHQRLLEPREQTKLVDAFGGHEGTLEAYRAARAEWLAAAERLRDFERLRAERRDRLDLVRFQLGELESAGPDPEEGAALTDEREVLRHAEELGTTLGGLLARLADGDDAALDAVRHAERTAERWSARVRRLESCAEELRAAGVHLAEGVEALRALADEIDFSPARLEAVEGRLAELEALRRKYGRDLAGLAALVDELRAEQAALEAADDDREDAARALATARAELERRAAALTKARKAVRPRLRKAVAGSLAALGLERADFDVRVAPREASELASPNADPEKSALEADERRFGPDGADEVELLLAANPGERAGPLRKVASGGETARIMLALRKALAVRQTIPTLVFDEVDAGVGGHLAPKVGAHLRAVAEHHQILCVTHLPAVAAHAQVHLKAEKRVERGRTRTVVRPLDGEERVQEVADMIAGGAAPETARAEARRLLSSVGAPGDA